MQSPPSSSSTANLLTKTDFLSDQQISSSSLSESQGSGADSSDISTKRNIVNTNAPLTHEMEEVFSSLERFLIDLDATNIGRNKAQKNHFSPQILRDPIL
jgi:hypothetical protein